MKTVTLEIGTTSKAMDRFVQTWETGKRQTSARICFATPELLWKVLTAKRWELLKALCGAPLDACADGAHRQAALRTPGVLGAVCFSGRRQCASDGRALNLELPL